MLTGRVISPFITSPAIFEAVEDSGVQRRSLGREIQKLVNNEIRLDETKEGRITAYALAQTSLVAHVKAKQDEDPYLLNLKEGVRNKEITSFTLGSDGVLKLNDQLCVSDVDGLRKTIMEEAHSSMYSIHPGATKMYLDFKELYWWKRHEEASGKSCG
uniref:Uncharacterized protein LOC104242432 n=1 Tax=Nicotiana sylvestris TaxID=4096 RepID=A0A1U7XUV8_NICSY|nr:PREDICTED: uncharacterized protein LOC104242432 [Nicotiana sylvestris]